MVTFRFLYKTNLNFAITDSTCQPDLSMSSCKKKEIIQVRHTNKSEDFVDYLMVDNVIYIGNEILGKVGKLIHLNLAKKPPPSNSEIDKTIHYGI